MEATAEPSRQEPAMSSPSLRRRALPLLLCAGLLAPWAAAATAQKARAAQAAAPAASSLLDRAWRLLQSLWGEEGCMIDPHDPGAAAGYGDRHRLHDRPERPLRDRRDPGARAEQPLWRRRLHDRPG